MLKPQSLNFNLHIVFFVLLSIALVMLSDHFGLFTNADQVDNEYVEVLTEADYYLIDAQYPNTPEARAVLEGVMAELTSIADFDDLSPEEAELLGFRDESGQLTDRKYFFIAASDKTASANIQTYLVLNTLYTGGAHPISYLSTFSYELLDDGSIGSSVEISDLFAPESDYLSRLVEISERELLATLGSFADTDFIRSGLVAESSTFSSFYLHPDGLVLVFQPYQVAPYAAGLPEILVPFTEIEDIFVY